MGLIQGIFLDHGYHVSILIEVDIPIVWVALSEQLCFSGIDFHGHGIPGGKLYAHLDFADTLRTLPDTEDFADDERLFALCQDGTDLRWHTPQLDRKAIRLTRESGLLRFVLVVRSIFRAVKVRGAVHGGAMGVGG